jgi:hypothetical protein
MKSIAWVILASLASAPAAATIVNVDMSGAVSGPLIDADGASFARAFDGQTVVGIDLVGAPTSPLSLDPSGSLTLQFWDPVVSPGSKSIFDFQEPLAVLLDQDADSLTLTMGSASPPSSITVDLYAGTGALVDSTVIAFLSGYNVYTISGLGTFRGAAFRLDTDGSGVRFQNFSYNAVEAADVPEPAALGLLGFGLAVAGALRRRR